LNKEQKKCYFTTYLNRQIVAPAPPEMLNSLHPTSGALPDMLNSLQLLLTICNRQFLDRDLQS